MSLRQAIRLQSCRNKCGWRHLFNYDLTEQCEGDCVDTIVFGGGRIAGTPFVQNGLSLGAQGIVLPGTGVTEAPKPGQPSMLSSFGFPPSPATVLALVVIAVAAYFLFFRK